LDRRRVGIGVSSSASLSIGPPSAAPVSID
jgi:hypothetical protein